jgi:hypothetical protein
VQLNEKVLQLGHRPQTTASVMFGIRSWLSSAHSARLRSMAIADRHAAVHRLYAEHVLDDHGAPQDDRLWQTTPPKPTDPIDRANWQSIVAAGAPTWLGKGWGMKVAKSGQACLFGGRFELMPNSTLGEIDAELRRVRPLIERMAAH